MSSNRFGPQFAPLRYDPSRAFVPFTAISRTELIALNDRLDSVRRELLSDSVSQPRGETAFVDLPERMLADYQQSRGRSELGRILAVGKRLRDTVDRVVIVAAGGANLGARALFDAGCHPYHNELSRGDRGGRPRIYFADDSFDNDAIQALLDLLCHTRPSATVDERWAIIAIDESGKTPEAAALRCLLAALRCLLALLGESCAGDRETRARLVVPIAGVGSPLSKLAAALGCAEEFGHRGGAGGWNVLSAAGLLPAAVMGLDVVRLLQAAAQMNERFRTAPPGDNPALDYAAVSHLFESLRGAAGRRIVPWASAVESAARWCDQLRATRFADLRDQAASGGVTTNLIVDSVRRDRLLVPTNENDTGHDENQAGIAGRSFSDLQSAAVRNAGEAFALQKRPTADLHLPALDESALGQFFQMMVLATAIEGRLIGECPYSQAPNTAYKSK